MNLAHGRLIGGVVLAVLFAGSVIFSIEKGISFLEMSLGFWVVAVAGFVLINLRSALLYFGATVALLLGGYVAYKVGMPGVRWGAGAAAIANVILWFFWVRPNTSTQFDPDAYAREQAKLRAEEGRGPSGPGAVPRS